MQRMMTEKPEKYQHMLQNLVFKAQQVRHVVMVCLHVIVSHKLTVIKLIIVL